MDNDQKIKESIKKLSQSLDADVFLYSGAIDRKGAHDIMEVTSKSGSKNVVLFLCTFGGDPNAAYRIAKRLQTKYEKFYLYVYGFCKSAGTLIAIGSDEIIMSDNAEFGPLDIQVSDGEELGRLSSGLNIFEALRALIHNIMITSMKALLSFLMRAVYRQKMPPLLQLT